MSLKQRIVSAVGWSVAVKLFMQIVTWVMTLVVIRLLAPEDYGLMAISQVFLNFMLGFASMGLGDALVQREDTPREVVGRVFGLALAIGAVLAAVLSLGAYPIADWYGDARLVPLIQVSSLGFLFNAVSLLPRAFLMKSLRVRPMFIIEVSSGFIGACVTAVLAWLGHGVWALMLGWLVGAAVRMAGFVVLTAEYFTWPRLGLRGVGALFSFGVYRAFEHIVWIVATSLDVLIIGHWLGPAAVGVYTVALNFAMMPISKVAPILNATAFPAFAMVQSRPAEARFYLLKAMRMMSVVAVPVFFGIFAIAPEIVELVFGPNWEAAKPVLAILALASTLRAIPMVVPNFLQGIGESKASFWCSAVGLAILPPALIIGCQWGIVGAAYGWLVAAPLQYLAVALIASRRGSVPLRALFTTPLPPVAAGVAMLGAVGLTRLGLPPAGDLLLRTCVLMVVGAMSYCAVILLAFQGLAGELLGVVRRGPRQERQAEGI